MMCVRDANTGRAHGSLANCLMLHDPVIGRPSKFAGLQHRSSSPALGVIMHCLYLGLRFGTCSMTQLMDW